MNIKELLKNYDMKLYQLSQILFLSRPTLNNYISLYEKNEKLPDQKYQILFDRLFKEAKSKEEFYETIEASNKLLAKDLILDTTKLSPKKTDLLSFIVDDMKRDMESDNYDERIYRLILMLINSYKNLNVFKELANYFLALNNLIDYNDLNEEEMNKILCYYSFFTKLKNNEYKIEKNLKNNFIQRINELKENQQKKEEKISNDLNELIQKEIKKQVSAGKSIDSIKLDEIISRISANN